MQIITNYCVSNFKASTNLHRASNPQFKAVPIAKTAGLTTAAATALGTVLFAELAAKKRIPEYKPEDNFANKKAKESAQIIERILTYRDLAALSEMQDEDGELLFDDDNMKKIAKKYTDYLASIKELAEFKTKDGKHRFNGDGIITLTESYTNEPYAVKRLATIKNKKGDYILSANEIKQLVETYKKYSKEVEELALIEDKNGRRFAVYNIINIAETYKNYPEGVKGLVTGELEGYYYVTDEAFNFLAKSYSKYPNAVTELLKMAEDSEKNKRLNYSPESQCAVAKLAEPYSTDPDFVKELLMMKMLDDEYKYRFDLNSVCNIAEAYVKAPTSVRELVEMKTPKGDKYRFNAVEICEFAKKGPEYLDSIKRLASIANDKGYYYYSVGEIEALLGVHKKYPEAVEKLSTMTVESPSGRKCVFKWDFKYVQELAEWYHKYPDIVQHIIDTKFDYYYNPSIDKTIEMIKEAVNKLQ